MTNPAQHAAVITDLVVKHGWDGVELDYEHLWSAADRAPYVALVKGGAAAARAGQGADAGAAGDGADHKDAAYDYAQFQDDADVMHLMAYDYHYYGGDHLGPIAPKGWVNDVVTRVKSLGHPEKYTLGLANYGIAGGWYTNAKDAAARCMGGAHSMATDHMATCPMGHQDAGLVAALHDPAGRRLVRGRGVDVGEGAARQGRRLRRRRLLDDGRRDGRLLHRDERHLQAVGVT